MFQVKAGDLLPAVFLLTISLLQQDQLCYYHTIVSLILQMSVVKSLWKKTKNLGHVSSLLEAGSLHGYINILSTFNSEGCFSSFPEDGPNL